MGGGSYFPTPVPSRLGTRAGRAESPVPARLLIVATVATIGSVKAVGIKALKNELSRYLHIVRGGERVLVLDRDEVVAEIRPPSSTSRGSSTAWDAMLDALDAEGVIRRATTSVGSMRSVLAKAPLPAIEGGAAIAKEARGDRR